MSNVIKSKKIWWLVLICLLGSLILIVFNLAQFKRYQLTKRNNERKTEISSIVAGIKNYVKTNTNLPTTSNPSEKSFLPELILLEDKKPSGGVNVQSLENMAGYVDTNIKDPSGNPYFIGTFDDKIIVYTNSLELDEGKTDVYFEQLTLDTNNAGSVK
jgi:hypothetical protein